jgi:hypothetical protein
MELALNLLWLLVASAALGWWLAGRDARSRRQFLVGLAALGCSLVLFFPVVSASDDLHSATPAMEDYSLSARKLRAAGQSSAWHATFVAPVVSPFISPVTASEGTITSAPVVFVALTPAFSLSGRAPPFFLLG